MRKLPKEKLKSIYKQFTKADKILIIFLIFLSVLFFAFFNKLNSNKYMEIYYKGELYGRYPLNKNKIIKPDKGIEIQIKKGKARVIHSTCKRKYCVKQGWSNSYPIVCVPNKLVIKFNDSKRMLITK